MVKRLLFSIMLLFSSNNAFASSYIEQYNKLKENFENKYNINFGIDASHTIQNISSNTISRNLITPYLNKVISDSIYGTTFFNFSANFLTPERFPSLIDEAFGLCHNALPSTE